MTYANQAQKERKEVQLEKSVLNSLQRQADKTGRSLKNYMEYVLIQQSKSTQPIK